MAHPIHTVIRDAELLRRELLQVTEHDLTELAAWVPPGAAEVVRVLGLALAARLFGMWPGVVLQVPVLESSQRHGIERRAELVAALGEQDATALCSAWGGELLVLPVMRSLLSEKRKRWLRAEFDRLTAEADITKTKAVLTLGLRLGAAGLPMTTRQIMAALDRPGSDPPSNQIDLFQPR